MWTGCERRRLAEQLQTGQELENVCKKPENVNFVSRAKPDVVEQVRPQARTHGKARQVEQADRNPDGVLTRTAEAHARRNRLMAKELGCSDQSLYRCQIQDRRIARYISRMA